MSTTLITNELDVLETLVPLADVHIVEAGCGAAHLARELVSRHPTTEVVGIEVDERQLAKNLLTPVERLRFERAGAQAIPCQRYESPVAFANFDEFEQRMMRPTFADHGIDEAMVESVRLRYLPHQGPSGARFTRPMRVRLLRKTC